MEAPYIEFDPATQYFCGVCRTVQSNEGGHLCAMSAPMMPLPDSPTLRDQFAMAALTGIMVRNWSRPVDKLANMAYEQADAMLAARKPKP